MKSVLDHRAQFDLHWVEGDLLQIAGNVKRGITAVLTVSDLLAVRVLTEASQAGIRCPEDLSIVGFDDLPLATAVRPMLTTVAPDVAEISKRAVAYLTAAIEKTPPLPKAETVDMALILRGSATNVPAKIDTQSF